MAKKLLFDEYGNEFKVANSYIEKLHDWPLIQSEDGKALHETIFLLNFFETMSNNNQLQSPQEILNVTKKLPYKLKDRWRRKCNDILKKLGTIRFKDSVDFVQDEAEVLQQLLFGEIPREEKTTGRVKRNLSTISKENSFLEENTENCELNST